MMSQKYMHVPMFTNTRWKSLQNTKSRKEDALAVMKALQDYNQMCDETKDWMIEKDQALTTDDTGRDLAGVQVLQRRHQVQVSNITL